MLKRLDARAGHLPIELVSRLPDGELPVRISREHRGLWLGVAVDDVLPASA